MCGIKFELCKKSLSSDIISKLLYFNDKYINLLKHRGPNDTCVKKMDINNYYLSCIFHRLSIVDIQGGKQPFIYESHGRQIILMCNGEIYNYKELTDVHKLPVQSNSDCEVILYLYIKYGVECINLLLGEFAFILIDSHLYDNQINLQKIFIGRDPFGVRPLFYVISNDFIGMASEAKGLLHYTEEIKVFPQSSYMLINKFMTPTIIQYYHLSQYKIDNITNESLKQTFIDSIIRRVPLDQDVGCLLSGGLDSSIVASIAQQYLNKHGKNLYTFTIGFNGGTDIQYAERVAKHINSIHKTFIVEPCDAINSIIPTIRCIESYDITSIRASTMQYMLIENIVKEYDFIKVFLCGEGSDELLQGYAYFKRAPTIEEGLQESFRLLKNIHMFDGLRADRTLAHFGKELRLPFLDTQFVDAVFSMNPDYISPKYGNLEKYLIRQLFIEDNLIPLSILLRPKEAFSDGCSSHENSWYSIIQKYTNENIPDSVFEKRHKYTPVPFTKESLYYRLIFNSNFDSKNSTLIPYYWMPKWSSETNDPSARTLSIYTK